MVRDHTWRRTLTVWGEENGASAGRYDAGLSFRHGSCIVVCIYLPPGFFDRHEDRIARTFAALRVDNRTDCTRRDRTVSDRIRSSVLKAARFPLLWVVVKLTSA